MPGKRFGLGFLNSRFAVTNVYDSGFTRPDNRFIPVASDDLIDYLAADEHTFGESRLKFRELGNSFIRVLEQEKSAFERLMVRDYARVNPDRETIDVLKTGPPSDDEFELLNRKLQHMLEKANFEQLSDDQVKAAVEAANTRGIRVKLDAASLREMAIWVRGRSTAPHVRRTLAHPVHGESRDIAVFNRLALITRPADQANVQIRLFKDIPIQDVEALLPHAKVRMGLRDGVVMAGSGAGALWTVVTKVLAFGLVAASQLLWIVAVPLAGLSWKVFSGYRGAIKNRDSSRARHLYFQSLGANRSSIHMISYMICDEEIKESILLYAFCLDAESDGHSVTKAGIKASIEEYLRELTSVEIDFDVDDAIETLNRLDLWKDRHELTVVGESEATEMLETYSRSGLSRGYHARLLGVTE
ncbi:MAG: DUF3754 domain-containing protein [Chloroflexi bacterium]|nr:DUF3754 domain-containing protein [Chloroflexota bacterium]